MKMSCASKNRPEADGSGMVLFSSHGPFFAPFLSLAGTLRVIPVTKKSWLALALPLSWEVKYYFQHFKVLLLKNGSDRCFQELQLGDRP